MFNPILNTPSNPSEDEHLVRAFSDPGLFPEITAPKQREEAIYGFQKYLEVINDIFTDQLRNGKFDHVSEEDSLREEWQKRFQKADERVAKRKPDKKSH